MTNTLEAWRNYQWLHAHALRSGDRGWFVKASIEGPGPEPGPPGWFTHGDDRQIRGQVAEVISSRVGRPIDPSDVIIDYHET